MSSDLLFSILPREVRASRHEWLKGTEVAKESALRETE